jgi:hypothetical protein
MSTKFLVCEHGGGYEQPRLFVITARDHDQVAAYLNHEDHEGTVRTILPLRNLGKHLADQPSKSIMGWTKSEHTIQYKFNASVFPHANNAYLLHPEHKSDRGWDTDKNISDHYNVYTGEDLNATDISTKHKPTQRLFTAFLGLADKHAKSTLAQYQEPHYLTLFRPHPFRSQLGLSVYKPNCANALEVIPPTNPTSLRQGMQAWVCTQQL